MEKYRAEIKAMHKRTFWIMLMAFFISHTAFHVSFIYERPDSKIYVYQNPSLEEFTFDFLKKDLTDTLSHMSVWTLDFINNSSDIPANIYNAYLIFMSFCLLFVSLCCAEAYALRMYAWENFFKKYGIDFDKERKNVS